MSDRLLEEYQNTDWNEVTVKLARYGQWLLAQYGWSGATLPRSKILEDVIGDSIEKVIRGLLTNEQGKGVRRWRSNKTPNLLVLLKGAVRSDLNSLLNAKEHDIRKEFTDNDFSRIDEIIAQGVEAREDGFKEN